MATVPRKRRASGLTVRRGNALLRLDDGCDPVRAARVLYPDIETIRGWQRGFAKDGLASLDLAEHARRDGHLNQAEAATRCRRRSWAIDAY